MLSRRSGSRLLTLALFQDNTSQPQEQSYTDTPPTYEVAVEETNGRQLCSHRVRGWMALLTLPFLEGVVRVLPQPLDQKIPPQGHVAVYQSHHSQNPNANIIAGPSVPGSGIPTMPQSRVYHYVNPNNGNHITSLLPPDHPEMVCLQQGSHVEETKFGFLGEFCSACAASLSRRPVLMRVC